MVHRILDWRIWSNHRCGVWT